MNGGCPAPHYGFFIERGLIPSQRLIISDLINDYKGHRYIEVHIGSFNLLIEDVDGGRRSDAKATHEFFLELKNITKEFEEMDQE